MPSLIPQINEFRSIISTLDSFSDLDDEKKNNKWEKIEYNKNPLIEFADGEQNYNFELKSVEIITIINISGI